MERALLEREALRLPVQDRALLADSLLNSLDDEAERALEAKWAAESEARRAAYKAGQVEALDGPAALAKLRRQFTP